MFVPPVRNCCDTSQTVGLWQRIYTDDQRAAIHRAAMELRIRPWRRICEMAATGELTPEPDAPPLPPFKLNQSSARSIAMQAERRRRGLQVPARLVAMDGRERARSVQLRLAGIIDNELEKMEKRQHKGAQVDPRELQALVRTVRELQALPDPDQLRVPRATGQREPDGRLIDARPAPDSLAGQALRSIDKHASEPPRINPQGNVTRARHATRDNGEHEQHAEADTHNASETPENTGDEAQREQHEHNAHNAHNASEHAENTGYGEPCSPQSEQVEGLAADQVRGVPTGT